MSKHKKYKKYQNKFYHSNQAAQNGEKIQTQEDVKLIALDSNVFIDMSHEMVGKRRNVNDVTDNFYDRIAVIRRLAEEGKLKFVIPPNVLQEVTFSGLTKSELYFMQKYCVILQPKNEKEMAQKVAKLTGEYLRNKVIDRGNSKHPFGDAMIMAQASLAGLNLLTNNYRDFEMYSNQMDIYKKDALGDIVPKKMYNDEMLPKNIAHLNENELEDYLKIKGRYRALAIGKVNHGMGLTYENKNGYKVTPMPFTTMDFIGKKKEEEGLWVSNQFVTNFNSEEFDLVPYEQDK